MFVNMQVKCISERCKGCDELEIDIDRIKLTGMPYDPSVNVNTLYCCHYKRCQMIQDDLIDQMAHDESERKERNGGS